MGTTVLTFVILAVFVQGTTAVLQGHCDSSRCRREADQILDEDTFDCSESPRRILEALDQCVYGCDQSAADPLIGYGKRLDTKMRQASCISGRAVSCNVTDILDCTFKSVELVNIIRKIQIQDLTKLCSDISKILSVTQSCTKCFQVLLPGFQSWSDTSSRIIDMIFSLTNGACNCTRDIMGPISRISNSTGCDLVSNIVDAVRIVAVDCAGKLINMPLQVDWLTQVNTYLSSYLPYVGNICLWVVGAGTVAHPSGTLMAIIVSFSLIVVARFKYDF